MPNDPLDPPMVQFELVQPTLRREWHLRRDGESVATMRVPILRRGASAQAGDATLRIERASPWPATYRILDSRTGDQMAAFRNDRRRRTLEVGGRSGHWRPLRDDMIAIDETGAPLLQVQLRAHRLRSAGTVHVHPALRGLEGIAAALLAAHTVIRERDQTAAAASAPLPSLSA